MAKNNTGNPFASLQSIRNDLPVGEPVTPQPAPAQRAAAAPAAPQQLPDSRSRTIGDTPRPQARIPRSSYDSLLANEREETHNPNPFDFVFFTETAPRLYTRSELEKGQDLFSGYMDVQLTALTPIHIAGKQVPDPQKLGKKISRSCFYKQGNSGCIPGSSIRGMLRAFVEALTNGWVSQSQEENDNTPAYPKVYGPDDPQNARHIGFDSFKVTENTHGSGAKSRIQPAIPPGYRPEEGEMIDIASYLFGSLLGDKSVSRWKVRVEDAPVNILVDKPMIDIDYKAFMGGSRPSVSNWWYMIPSRIAERHGTLARGGHYSSVEMIGEGAWGRKFYFHQNPDECIPFYKDRNEWPEDEQRPLYDFKMECLDNGKSCTFRIDFERIPGNLLNLLCLCLIPGDKIRHKIGYAKQYGYGSVAFSIQEIVARNVSAPFDIEDPDSIAVMKHTTWNLPAWSDRDSIKIGNNKVIDDQALAELARILGWDDVYAVGSNILCTYPPYRSQYFQTLLRPNVFRDKTGEILPLSMASDQKKALEIAKKLWGTKKTIHFLLYQARAKGYGRIKARKP